MPLSNADDDEIQVHVVPTFDGGNDDDRVKKNRLRFARRRSSSGNSSINSRGSFRESFTNMVDMIGMSERSDDNLHLDPEETFATAAPAGGNRYDPSRFAPKNEVIDFDLDGMNDDGSLSQMGGDLDESSVFDETTGQRFSGSAGSDSKNKKRTRRLAQSSISFCKQFAGHSLIPLLVLLSVGAGFLAFATSARSSSSAAPPQLTDSYEILLYQTETAINAACTQQGADWDDLSTCRELCRTSMCCFDLEKSKTCYRADRKGWCNAHAACSAITSFPSQITKPYRNEKEKLVLSEMILLACSRNMLDKDMGNCQKLCKNMMCCFDEEDEYNCASKKGEECLVHAGCEALVQGH